MNNFVTSVIRTVVPMLVSSVVSWLALHDINLDENTALLLSTVLFFLIGFVYYVVVRLLESKWPQLGKLLGVPVKPTYGDE